MSQRKLKKIRQIEKMAVEETKKDYLPKFWSFLFKNWKFLIAIILLSVGLFANGMKGDFVSDDYASITQNPNVGDFSYMFTGSNFGNSQTLTTFLVYKLFGNSSPIPYHVISLVYFIIFTILAYGLIFLVIKNDWIAKLTTILFIFLPIHVEAVSWISGRIYIILGIYTVAALINFIYYIDREKPRYLISSGIFFLLGFLTDKPRPFALFLLMAVYMLYIGIDKIKQSWWRIMGISALLGIVAIVVAWPNITRRINIVNSGYNSTESIFYNPFFQYPTGVSKYLQLLWFPSDLTLYHTMYVLPNWLNWVIILTYLLAIVYFCIKNKPYFFALAFIMAATFPSISPIKVSWLVAERYMFLGSLGFCLFVVLILMDVAKYLRLLAPVLGGCLISYYGVRLILRNADWRTNHSLWVNTCQVSPNSHNAWNNIGDDYDKLKDYNNAVKGFSQSTFVKPNYADAYHNRANIFFKGGRLDLARESYGIALNFTPSLFQTYLSLCQIDLNERRYDLALAHAQEAIKIEPNNPQPPYVAAVTYAQMGDLQSAKTILNQMLITYPDFPQTRMALEQIKKMEIGNTKN